METKNVMKSILTIVFSFVFLICGFSQTRNVVVGTNDVIVQPTNFWSANASNGRSGLGLGSAATNPASAFQPSSSVLSNLASSNGINITNIQATSLVGTIPSSNIATVNFSNLAGTLSIASGGTGATNAATARQNLGASTVGNSLFIATNAAAARTAIDALAINGDGSSLTNLAAINITGTLSVAQGGTGASNAGSARTNLGIPLDIFTNTSVSSFLDSINLGWDALTNSNAATSLLGFDGNGDVVVNTGTNVLTFTNDVRFDDGSGNFIELGGSNINTFYGNTFITYTEEDWSFGGSISFGGTNAASNIFATRSNLGFSTNLNNLWTSTNASNAIASLFGSNTNPVLVNTNGEVVSPTNFWQEAPITTTFIESQPTTNSSTNISPSRLLHIHSLSTNVVNTTNTIILPTNALTFEGDMALVVHKGPTNSLTQVRQAGSTNNLITLSNFNEAVEFTYYNDNWQFLETASFTAPIYFSGTNATANAATSRTNLGLGATWLTNTNVTNFRTAIGLGTTNIVTFSNVNASGVVAAPYIEANEFFLGEGGIVNFEGSGGTINFEGVINFGSSAAGVRTNLGLGASNNVVFGQGEEANVGIGVGSTNTGLASGGGVIQGRLGLVESGNIVAVLDGDGSPFFGLYQPITFQGTNATANASTTRTNLGLGFSALTNTNAAGFQRAIFQTNTTPAAAANLNDAKAWLEISVVTNNVTNSFRIPVFQ